MTLEIRKEGSIFDSGADILVNPVNCVGVSGKGLALEFKKRFPLATKLYEAAAEAKSLQPGRIYRYREDWQIIYYFTTKDDWRSPSQMPWIWSGLLDLAVILERDHNTSIAVPAIGCGLGGLKWGEVWRLLKPLTEIHYMKDWIIYPPQDNR